MTEETNLIDMSRWPTTYRKIPYGKIKTGYVVNKDNPLEVNPDPEQIKYLEEAFDYLEKGASLREACDWLTQKLLRTLNYQTINNLYNQHRKPFIKHKRTNKRKPTHRITAETKKLMSAKRIATFAKRKADKLAAKKHKPIPVEDYDTPPEKKPKAPKFSPIFPELPKEVNILFQPNPGPQTLFLSSNESEILFGGSAGGGKSYAMLADPMRFFDNPNFVGLLLRRTNDELRELKRESQKLYPKLFNATWREKDSMWKFPSGAEFWMSYLDRDDDVLRYQGQSFCWIGIDELTQYPTPYAWNYLKSRLRSTDPKLQPHLRLRASCNPGGPGHQWVKKMFVDPSPPGTSFWAKDLDTDEIIRYPKGHEKEGQPLFKRKFIPSLLSDNPHLALDGNYERGLLGLPEDQRRKLLYGDWTVVEGAAFPEFSIKTHVCAPFEIPREWRRFRSADYGYTSHTAVLWFAIDPSYETLYVYRELYGSKMTGQDLALKVLSLEKHEQISYGMLDSSVWHERGTYGPTVAEEMIALGCKWRPSDRGKGSRVAGKNRLHELLKTKEINGLGDTRPGIVFFDTCRQLIADLPSIPSDPDGGDDIDDRYKSDHTYDALRYGIMSRPRSSSPLDWGSQPRDRYTPSDSVFGY